MKRYTVSSPNFDIHKVITKKYRELRIIIRMSKDVKKEEITINNILIKHLLYNSKKYPSKIEFNKKALELYSPIIFSQAYLSGNKLINEFSVSMIDEKYSEENANEQVLDFLFELLLNPSFDNVENLEEYKRDVITNLKEIKDDKIVYAKDELDLLSNEKYLSLNKNGYIEDLDSINLATLEEYYKKFFKDSKIDIYMMGNITNEDEIILNKFKINSSNKITKNNVKNKKYQNEKYKEINEDINQSIIAMGLKIKNPTRKEKYITGRVYNAILGEGFGSKLNIKLREENSLCYYAFSHILGQFNYIKIMTGISSNNYDKAVTLIKECIKEIEENKYDEEKLKEAKESIINSLKMEMDYQGNYLRLLSYVDSNNLKSINSLLKNIEKITMKDIEKYSKKLHIDAILFLKGVE